MAGGETQLSTELAPEEVTAEVKWERSLIIIPIATNEILVKHNHYNYYNLFMSIYNLI